MTHVMMRSASLALQGVVGTTVAPDWRCGASQVPVLSTQQSSSGTDVSAASTPQGMSVGLGLGPAGLELIQTSMNRELGGFSYNDLWAASQLQQAGDPGSPHPYGAGLLHNSPAFGGAASYNAAYM